MTQLDNVGCYNNTMKVAAGHYIDLLNPDPAHIEIESIAAALSKLCRFGGHSPGFYSVAEHSVLAADMALKEGNSLEVCKAILLHDAAEAYVGDMVKPLKLVIPNFEYLEDKFERAIESAFNVDFSRYKESIKRYDRMMLKAEKLWMWPDDSEPWHGFAEVETRIVKLRYFSPQMAKSWFLILWDHFVNGTCLRWRFDDGEA